jgi:hypothetical protein
MTCSLATYRLDGVPTPVVPVDERAYRIADVAPEVLGTITGLGRIGTAEDIAVCRAGRHRRRRRLRPDGGRHRRGLRPVGPLLGRHRGRRTSGGRGPTPHRGVAAAGHGPAHELGTAVIRAQDRAGSIVNALLVPYLLPAVRMVESGFATAEDIDAGMVSGCAHPMGPLRLCDLEAGLLGRTSGRGFFEYGP